MLIIRSSVLSRFGVLQSHSYASLICDSMASLNSRGKILLKLALEKRNKSWGEFPSVACTDGLSSDEDEDNFAYEANNDSDYELDSSFRSVDEKLCADVGDILSPTKKQKLGSEEQITNNKLWAQHDNHDVCEILPEKAASSTDDQNVDFVVGDEKEKHEEVASKHPMLNPCCCKMKKCHQKFTENARKEIHAGFWTLEYDERRLWIYYHIERFEPKRRYTGSDNSKIQLSRNYWLPDAFSPTKKTLCL